MDNDTPPKRITRSRAAAKANAKPEFKITTAAAKAKATRQTLSTSIKRKTHSDGAVLGAPHDDHHDEEMDIIFKHKATRGKPSKPVRLETDAELSVKVETIASVTTKATRGRHKKIVEPEAPKQVRCTRGRSRKVDDMNELAEEAPQPSKKTLRTRAAAAPKADVPKKCVKFEEPDKENIGPDVTAKAESRNDQSAKGLNAKPVKKPAVTTRITRGRAKTGSRIGEMSPLSPKKATQVATCTEPLSEDELSTMEKTIMKPLMKSPVKAPGKAFDFMNTNRAVLPSQDSNTCLMASPARKPPPSPFKESLKAPPKKANLGSFPMNSPFRLPPKSTDSHGKMSLLQSPARRRPSPVKALPMDAPSWAFPTIGEKPKSNISNTTGFAAPQTSTVEASDLPEPFFSSTITQSANSIDGIQLNETFIKPFSGRLSAVLPRHADPALQNISLSPINNPTVDAVELNELCVDQTVCDQMAIDEIQDTDEQPIQVPSTTPNHSPPRNSIGEFGSNFLTKTTTSNFDSEDELLSAKYSLDHLRSFNIATSDFAFPSTPPRAIPTKTPKTEIFGERGAIDIFTSSNIRSMRIKKDKMPLAPLNQRFNDQPALSPPKFSLEHEKEEKPSTIGIPTKDVTSGIDTIQPSPPKGSFFEDEMSIREGTFYSQVDREAAEDMIGFAPAVMDEEDLELAAEADEMSLILADNVQGVSESITQSSPRALSEASREYGDENAIPVDPTLLALDASQEPHPSSILFREVTTPIHAFGERREREIHTVSKVPLKPAGVESPLKSGIGSELRNRSFSASRLSLQHVVPQPPLSSSTPKIRLDELDSTHITSPLKDNSRSTAVTPVRLPKRHLESRILKGAIVYVDVHTSEGADASALFVELLGQMGAKCVKSWNWNPSSQNGSPETDSEPKSDNAPGSRSGNKVGITHVVFKDGGKRTLEKVRESRGVVLCVGVSWVLDCERSNSWLSESPYAIDTSLVPRGGHRRRKSMEPRTIQNLNGILFQGPLTSRNVGNNHLTLTPESSNSYNTPQSNEARVAVTQSLKVDRRKSTQWVRSPDPISDSNDGLDFSSPGLLLSPVPTTPAPETISAYAEIIAGVDEDSETPNLPCTAELLQRTAPPKQQRAVMGEFGLTNAEAETINGTADSKNGGPFMQRLLQARRKSLQWAPKVGSPLAKGMTSWES